MGRRVLLHPMRRCEVGRIRVIGRRERRATGGWPRRPWIVLGCLLGFVGNSCQGPQQPEPPGDGQEVILDYGIFTAEIEPILQQRGCSNSACHGGQGSGQLLLSGGDAPDADFVAVRGLVTPWDPAKSALLLKPLAVAAGGVVHGGGDIFATTDDADYQTMLRWIVPETVP